MPSAEPRTSTITATARITNSTIQPPAAIHAISVFSAAAAALAAALSLVFNHMNQAQFHTRVETETTAATVDGQEVTQTTSTLYIHIAVESMT